MYRLHNTKHINASFLMFFIFILMFFSSFNSLMPEFKLLGFTSVFFTLTLSTLLLLNYFTKKKEIHRVHLRVFTLAFMMVSVMLLGIIINKSISGFENIFQFFTVICLFSFFSLIEWNPKKINMAKKMSLIFLLLLPVIANKGLIGAYLLLPLFFILLDEKRSKINFILVPVTVYFIYLSEMRALLILLGASLFTFIFWKFITKNRIRMSLFFTAAITLLISLIFIYPKLIYWSKFAIVENYVYELTGKTLMSGRNRLWDALADVVNQRPILGHGTGVLPRDFIDSNLSSHNLYLQTALQNGWVGLLLLISILFVIWISYYKSKHIRGTRISASFFVGIIVYQSFEVVLTQNKMDTALIFWLIISVGVSNSIYKKHSV